MEAMTDEVEEAARALMAKVEDLGGAVAAIETGFQKNEIEQTAYRVAQEIEAGTRVVVGVNKYVTPADERYDPLRVDPTIEEEQAKRLAALRAERSADDVRRALDDLRRAANSDSNVLYPMRDALAARATVGEVCHALREIWGSYTPVAAF
jgi:methylmalonyl-CoA mutase N-terminal domain/subunit